MVVTAMALATLLGFAGLAADVGFAWNKRRQLQTAADAAALAAEHELLAGQSGALVQSATDDAARNGFTAGVGDATLTVNNPPASGLYAGNSQAVEVIVSQPQPAFFLRVLGFASLAASARAVAASTSASTCVYVLDPNADAALMLEHGAHVTMQCGVLVDSTSPTALVASSGSSLSAPSIGVVGSYSSDGGSSLHPAPTSSIATVQDPLADLEPPVVGACNYTSYVVSHGSQATLNPGVYCNGISVTDGASATLNPGLYVLDGGGLTVEGGARLSGSGVVFYNTQGAAAYGPLVLANGSQVTLAAPLSGPLAGILFFQDRAVASPPPSVVANGSQASLTGVLYLPTSTLSFANGSGAAGAWTVLVARDLAFTNGSTDIAADYSSMPAGSPIRQAVLVE
jgi:hypothetical protein